MSRRRPSQGRRSLLRRLRAQFSHRRLIMLEALLLIGALETLAEDQLLASTYPPWVKVFFSMALVVGLFGGLLLATQRVAAGGLERTRGVVQALPLPATQLLLHLGIFAALYLLYAWIHGIRFW